MAIKTSGEISFADIQLEFGGSGPISLNEYYRGGGLVPPGTVASQSAFTQVLLGQFNNVQIPTGGEIQMSQFYGQAAVIVPPSDVLLTNTGDTEAFTNWISPYTGTAYVTLIGSGSAGGNQGSGWGGFADSGGGSGGGGAGQILYRQAVQVVKDQAYPYKVKPVTYVMGPDPTVDPETGQPVGGEIPYAQDPRTEMFGFVAANGQPGQPGDHFYNGGAGGISGGNSGDGGRGGNSRINTQGLAGFRGLPTTADSNKPWQALGGFGGAAGTGNASQSVAGQQGFGFGAGFGGNAGFKGSDNPDTAGGGGGGGGGYIPPLPGYDGNYMAASTGGLWFGAIGCIMIQFGQEPVVVPPTASYYPGATGQFDAFGGSPSTTARATLTLLPDGTAQMSGTNNPLRTERWITGTNGSAHEVSWEPHVNTQDWPNVNGGNIAPSVWFTMNSNWAAQVFDADSQTTAYAVFYLRIREIANPTNAVEYIVELNADGSCFAVGTLVRTPTGDRTVESLIDGELLSSFAEATMIDESTEGWRDWKIATVDTVKTDTTSTVQGSTRFTRSTSVKLNGIHSTLTHTYFVYDGEQYGWKIARDITMSDSFIDAELNLVPITSIEPVNVPAEFIALNVETLDTLQVKSGEIYILTHNVSA